MIVQGGFMEKITFLELLDILKHYDFYDWEDEGKKQYQFNLAMPEKLLEKLNFPEFYESFGIEAVQNRNAERNLKVAEWLEIENTFFNWLKNVENSVFTKKNMIVMPYFEKNWHLYSVKKWMQKDYKKYINYLENQGVIATPIEFHEDYRGAKIENFQELIMLFKMAIRGVPLLFLVDYEWAFIVTDSLTIRMVFKNESILKEKKNVLKSQLDFQLLE